MKNNRGITELWLEFTIIAIFIIFWAIIILYPRIFGNKIFIDTKQSYTKAITYLGNEKLEIDIDKWNDYEGEQIQVISKDGKVYLLSSFNTILIGE